LKDLLVLPLAGQTFGILSSRGEMGPRRDKSLLTQWRNDMRNS
jgi:hypothetical protein